MSRLAAAACWNLAFCAGALPGKDTIRAVNVMRALRDARGVHVAKRPALLMVSYSKRLALRCHVVLLANVECCTYSNSPLQTGTLARKFSLRQYHLVSRRSIPWCTGALVCGVVAAAVWLAGRGFCRYGSALARMSNQSPSV